MIQLWMEDLQNLRPLAVRLTRSNDPYEAKSSFRSLGDLINRRRLRRNIGQEEEDPVSRLGGGDNSGAATDRNMLQCCVHQEEALHKECHLLMDTSWCQVRNCDLTCFNVYV